MLDFLQNFTNFLRLGADCQIDDGCKSFSIRRHLRSDTSVTRLKEVYDATVGPAVKLLVIFHWQIFLQQVVAATTATVGSHPLLAKRRFDVVILDESCLLFELTCLGPLFCADSFILISDNENQQAFVNSNTCKFVFDATQNRSQIIRFGNIF